MAHYRGVIELYALDMNGGEPFRQSETIVTFSADSEEAARAELRAQTLRYFLKKRLSKDVRYHSRLYLGTKKVYEITGSSVEMLTPEGAVVAEAFFKYKEEHPESVPYEQLTPLQQRMQCGGPGIVEKKS